MAKIHMIPGGPADRVVQGTKTAVKHVVNATKRGFVTSVVPTMLATNADATQNPAVQAGIAIGSFGLGVMHYAGEQSGINKERKAEVNANLSTQFKGRK
jgi:hypothetical protein